MSYNPGGKGCAVRPTKVGNDVAAANWDNIFNKKSFNGPFIIVKFASDETYGFYWEVDPKSFDLHAVHSAANTHTGKEVGIKDFYTNKFAAQTDCEEMNKRNPCGNYAVCTVDKDTLPK